MHVNYLAKERHNSNNLERTSPFYKYILLRNIISSNPQLKKHILVFFFTPENVMLGIYFFFLELSFFVFILQTFF